MLAAHRTVETCVAVIEDATVRPDQPITLAIGRRGHTYDRSIEVLAAHRAIKQRIAEAEDAAVRGDQPISSTIGRGAISSYIDLALRMSLQ